MKWNGYTMSVQWSGVGIVGVCMGRMYFERLVLGVSITNAWQQTEMKDYAQSADGNEILRPISRRTYSKRLVGGVIIVYVGR